ncbi:hypothetical protein D910_00628 [Dendroctonus ponderosae]
MKKAILGLYFCYITPYDFKAGSAPALNFIDQETPVVLQGSASWTDSEGNPHQLSYVADENGYQPQSDDIPQAPEIPAAIARALEYIAAHPQPDSEKQQA